MPNTVWILIFFSNDNRLFIDLKSYNFVEMYALARVPKFKKVANFPVKILTPRNLWFLQLDDELLYERIMLTKCVMCQHTKT